MFTWQWEAWFGLIRSSRHTSFIAYERGWVIFEYSHEDVTWKQYSSAELQYPNHLQLSWPESCYGVKNRTVLGVDHALCLPAVSSLRSSVLPHWGYVLSHDTTARLEKGLSNSGSIFPTNFPVIYNGWHRHSQDLQRGVVFAEGAGSFCQSSRFSRSI
jgi:hypothetical protein